MFTKLIHFTKMSWMLYWRLLVVGTIIFSGRHNDVLIWIALLTSGVSVFGLNKTLLTWPLLRIFTKKRWIGPANGWGNEVPPTAQQRVPVSAGNEAGKRKGPGNFHVGPVGTPLNTASTNGTMTGFEPSKLEAHRVPSTPNMIGTPGAGLHGATGMTQTNISLGVKGEENFARALSITNQINRFSTIWSVPVPSMDYFEPGKYNTDIDCIIATESALFLVDLKNYKSGNVRYYSSGNQLYCEDLATGSPVGEPKTMTRNMDMATKAVRKHFPNANVVPVVVFMPTDKGEGLIDNVVWPGNVPAMNLTDFLAVLANQRDFHWKVPHAGAIGRFRQLLRMGMGTSKV